LVIGNIQGVRDTPDAAWQATCIREEASRVATRAQTETEKKPVTPLNVPDLQQVPVDIDKLKDAQTKDGTLERVQRLVKDGRRKTTRGGQEYQYVAKKGVLYRIFTKKTGGAEVETRQIVVPQEYRKYVMELAV
jgi:hypothetical protein